jgi:hypothetical protein
MKNIPGVSERPTGKIPTTAVTNELARAIKGMLPILEMGQVFPPRVTAPGDDLPTPQYQFQVYQGVTANTAGWDYVRAHPTV